MSLDSRTIVMRFADNRDLDKVVNLIGMVYAEYGDTLQMDGSERDLTDLQKFYFTRGGAFWVLEDSRNDIVGSHAAYPKEEDPTTCVFRRLYLRQELRGTEQGILLMQNNIDWAIEQEFAKVEFWSDVRFSRAHRFFEKFGFVTDGRVRHMTDGSAPYSERYFSLKLPEPT